MIPASELAERTVELASRYSTLRGIIEEMTSPVFSVDTHYRYVAFNRSHASVMRALYGTEIEVGRNMLDCMTVAQDRDQARANLDRALAGETVTESAYSGEAPRERRYFEVAHYPARANDGRIVGAVVLANDITERTQAELALRESEERYRSLFEQSPMGIYRTTPDGRILLANPALVAQLGYTSAEELSTTLNVSTAGYAPGHSRQDFIDAVERDGEVIGFCSAWMTKSGEVLEIRENARAIHGPDGTTLYYEGTAEDVTAQHRAQQALRESEERFRMLADSAPVLVWLADTTGGCTYFNTRWLEFTGRPLEAELGNGWAEGVHPEDLATCLADYMTAFRERRSFSLEYRLRRADGEFRWVLDNGLPRFLADGSFAGYIGTAVDITAHKQAELDLARLNRALRMLSETNEALIRIADEAMLLREVCRIVVEIGGHRMAWVGFAERDEARTVRPVAWAGDQSGYLESAQVSWTDDERGRGPVGTAIRTGQPSIVRSTVADPALAPWQKAAITSGFHSIIAMPLANEGQILGALGIYSSEPDAFDSAEVDILRELAGDLAFGITALRTRSKRDEAEAALRATERQLHTLIESIPDFIARFDSEGRHLYISPSIERAFGLQADRVVGRTHREFPTRGASVELDERLLAGVRQAFEQGVPNSAEMVWPTERGERVFEVRRIPERDEHGKVVSVLGITRDVTERREAEKRLGKELERGRRLLALYEKAHQLTEKELYDLVLDQAVELTDSTIGFLHLVSDDQQTVCLTTWNREALRGCTAPFETHYPLELAGNWVDCVRLRRPIVYNDFPSSPNQRGLPAGHSPLDRFMSIPVFEGATVRVIFGVGNKATPYDDHDVLQIQLIANEMQKIIRHRRGEEALKDSEERFRQLYEHAPLGYQSLDSDGRIIEVNQAWLAMLGYERDEVMGHWIGDFLAPGFVDRFRQNFPLFKAAGEIHDIEFEMVRKSGAVVVVAVDGRISRDSQGRFKQTHCILSDITERRRAEETSRRLAAIVESSSDAIIGKALDGTVLTWNQGAERIYGYSSEEMLGRHVSVLAPPGQVEEIAAILERTRHGERVESLETVRIAKNGRCINVSLTVSPICDRAGAVVGASTIARDITERKQAERTVARMAHEKGRILDSVGEGLCGLDTDGLITFMNPAGAAMLGWEPAEVMGKCLHEVCHHTRPDGHPYEKSDCPILHGLSEDSPRKTGSEVFVRRDGSTFPIEYVTTPIVDEGRLTGGVVVFRDVEARLQLEAQLQQARKMEALGQFASGIAHDFNNLVMVMAGTTELAQRRLPVEHPLHEELGTIQTTSRRATELTRGLLAFARRQVLQREDVEINTLVGGMLPMLRRLVPESISLTFDPDRDAGAAHVDPGQIEQVVMNLCVNARDAMHGAGILAIRTGTAVIDDAFRANRPWAAPGPHCWFSVQDTGEGMDEPTQARIFEPFFTTKAQGQGTGLGLATVYGIVKQHGGMIDLWSQPGEGSLFTVFLPRVSSAVMAGRSRETTVTTVFTGNERLLLVEDHDDLRTLIARMLAEHGYRVRQATNGVQALTILEGHASDFDLVITDVVMPAMGGVELYQRLSKRNPRLGFIFSTGYTVDQGPDELPRGQRIAFLTKPYSIATLLGKVRELLDQRDKPPGPPRGGPEGPGPM